MGLLADQVCIVTGAGQGLGRTISLEMAAEGAKLALLERNPETIAKVAEEIRGKGGTAETYTFDITDYDAYGKAVEIDPNSRPPLPALFCSLTRRPDSLLAAYFASSRLRISRAARARLIMSICFSEPRVHGMASCRGTR